MFSCTCALTGAHSRRSTAISYVMLSSSQLSRPSQHYLQQLSHLPYCSMRNKCIVKASLSDCHPNKSPFFMRKPCEFGYTSLHVTRAEVSCQGVFGILEMVASCCCNILQMFISTMVRRISNSARFSCMNVCCSCCSAMFQMHQSAPW